MHNNETTFTALQEQRKICESQIRKSLLSRIHKDPFSIKTEKYSCFFFFFSKGSGKKTNKKRSSRYTQCKTPVRSLKKFIKTVIFNIIICKTKVTLISPGSFVKANARSLLFSGGELGEDAGFSIQSLTGI